MELLSVHSRVDKLPLWIREFSPSVVCITSPDADIDMRALEGTRIFSGAHAMRDALAACEYDLLVNGVVGAAGLEPSWLALQSGRKVATANKESLVIAGELLVALARENNTEILPIDSEHSAIWQCLRSGEDSELEKIWLTASGGPFRNRPLNTFDQITIAEALGHPTWKMGDKITVDSATMMNKGFEIIEARWLFDVAADQIEVVIHPESIVHSAVAYRDGSVIAQMGLPDMRHPIQYALLHPDRFQTKVQSLNLASMGSLHFEAPDPVKFPALKLARQALDNGGSYPVALNAANEVAVNAFLSGQSGFLQIVDCVRAELDRVKQQPLTSLDDIYEVDRSTRESATRWLENHSDAALHAAGAEGR